jgi:mono/diheme cytochrome c family protein
MSCSAGAYCPVEGHEIFNRSIRRRSNPHVDEEIRSVSVFAGTIALSLWAWVPAAVSGERDRCAVGIGAGPQVDAVDGKFYQVVDGKVDARTYNGFRRYHAGCNHCHGRTAWVRCSGLPSWKSFPMSKHSGAVRDGRFNGPSVMKGFADDPNVAPYVDDIYAYPQARADGVLGRGRPARLEQ